MSENPCSEGNSVYRHTGCNICKLESTKKSNKEVIFLWNSLSIILVLRTLPQLKKLDNIEVSLGKSTTNACSESAKKSLTLRLTDQTTKVTPEEMAMAMRHGLNLEEVEEAVEEEHWVEEEAGSEDLLQQVS